MVKDQFLKSAKKTYFELLVAVIIIVIVGVGLLPTILTAIKTPPDRVFTGMWGYSADYIGYVSFIKEGIYGRHTVVFRPLPRQQKPNPIHIIYILIGKAASLFNLSAPFAYHLSRAIFGVLFVFLSFRLFIKLFKKRGVALITTIIAFTMGPLGWFTWQTGTLSYQLSTNRLIDSTVTRTTTRHHYVLGACLFVIIIGLFLILIYNLPVFKKLHSPPGRYLYRWQRRLSWVCHHLARTKTTNLAPLLIVFAGSSLGILLMRWSISQYPPQTNWYPLIPQYLLNTSMFSPKRFVLLDLKSIPQDILSFGPALWLAIAGFAWLTIDKTKKLINYCGNFYHRFSSPLSWTEHRIALINQFLKMTAKWFPGKIVKSAARQLANKSLSREYKSDQAWGGHQIMFYWFISQLLLYHLLYPMFLAERVRFIQTLFYLPMAYGTSIFLLKLSRYLGRWFFYVASFLLIFLFLPSYIHTFKTDLYSMTDFKNFSVFVFPTKAQYQAYQFLDQKTARESTILASYEAANHILIYSHNFVWGNPQGWKWQEAKIMTAGKDLFYSGTLPPQQALKYLTDRRIKYVYYGYQERFMGDISRYDFLKPIFKNKEVTIFKVKYL